MRELRTRSVVGRGFSPAGLAGPNHLRQGCGGPPKLHAKAEGRRLLVRGGWRSRRALARRAQVAVLTLALATPALLAQQRDARTSPVGTGEISGVVMSADAQPQPVRRAVVSVTGGDLPSARSVVTDDTGRFTFSRLPAGTFTVSAAKAAYLRAEYGQTKPGRGGSKIALGQGEKRTVTLTLFRGAVIAGTLRDAAGLPVSGLTVMAMSTATIATMDGRPATSGVPPPDPATTDDRGVYRLYGIMLGEYVIVSTPAPAGAGEIGARSAAETDALLAALTQRQNRPAPAGVTAPPLQPLPSSPSIGFAPIYFPGTPLYAEAGRIRVSAGEERDGVSFVVTHVPVATVEGIVSGDVPNLTSVQLAIIPSAPRQSGFLTTGGITSQPPDVQGEFKYGNLPPDRYRIVARARRGSSDPGVPPPGAVVRGGGRGGFAPPTPPGSTTGELLYAIADVDVRGQDVKGVSLQLRPGGTISGKLVFDSGGTALPDDFTGFGVGLAIVGGSYISSSGSTRVGNALSSTPPVGIEDDGTFAVTGIGPGLFYVNCTIPTKLTSIWKLRSAIVDGRDLLDTRVEGPVVQLTGVTLTLSDKRNELSGTLLSGSGQPVPEYYVVAFSADRANWWPGSRRNMSTRPSTDGRFVFADLPAGEYLVAALTDLDPTEWQHASFLEQIAPAAIKLTLAEGEKKAQDLKIR